MALGVDSVRHVGAREGRRVQVDGPPAAQSNQALAQNEQNLPNHK